MVTFPAVSVMIEMESSYLDSINEKMIKVLENLISEGENGMTFKTKKQDKLLKGARINYL